ncbi:MAG TPA: acyltransferase [Solirubrobacteraceae bacterium]|nr:acyltransferase [Solirubrobacteraceae bacterium]
MAAAPSALAPPPGNPRFPLLDSMRALAALSIVVFHAAAETEFTRVNELGAYTARLDVGVTLFFLLSGFLLYRPFAAARHEGRPPIRVRDYARRRVLRIVPAYWVALTLLALWPGLQAFWDGAWWRSYAFVQNLWGDSTLQGIFPAWTLCIEVSFYVLLPFLAVAIGRVAGARWRVELALLVALAAAAVAARALMLGLGGGPGLRNSLAGYLDWFAYGMILAVLSIVWRGREITVRPWIAWAGAAVAFWLVSTQLGLTRGLFVDDGVGAEIGEHLLYALVAALLLLPAIFGSGGALRRVLASRTLAWLGLVSYGVFLYHGPLVHWLDDQGAEDWLPGSGLVSLTVFAAAAAVACAAASYYLVERPVLRFKDPRGSSSASRSSAARASAGA